MRFSAAHLLRHAGKVGLVRYNCDIEGAVFRTVSNVLDMRKKSLGYADWIKLKSVISSRGFGFQAAWALMARDRSLNEIKVLIKVLEETNSLSNVLRAELLPIFGAYRSDCTLEDHQFIHRTIDEVLEFPVLPAELAGVLIDGLAAVPNWRDKYQTILSHPRGHSCEYSVSRVIRAAACTAFAHNDASLGWEMLNKITPSVSNLPSTVYDSIVRYHKSVPEENTLFTLFDFLERNHYQLTLQAAHEVQHIMERRKDWVARFSDVSVRGMCSCCRRKLGRIPLTDEEVNRLLQSLESFFKLNCKFNTYESQEVQEFKTFLQNCPPYTIVVDGLNLLFRSTRYKYTAPQKTQDLLKGLTKNGHKILVISRSHTQKMNAFNSIFKDQTTYFVRNRSHDDIFIIYAALHGGPNTFVMSNDSFGTHLQELQGSDRSLFRKWQFSCQMIGTGYLLMNTIFPQFSPVMQRTKDGSSIHIPLVPDGLYDSYAPFGWLCLNKVTATQKKRAMNIWPPKRVAFLQDEDPSSVVTNFAMYTHQIREAYAREYRIDFLQGKAAMIK